MFSPSNVHFLTVSVFKVISIVELYALKGSYPMLQVIGVWVERKSPKIYFYIEPKSRCQLLLELGHHTPLGGNLNCLQTFELPANVSSKFGSNHDHSCLTSKTTMTGVF